MLKTADLVEAVRVFDERYPASVELLEVDDAAPLVMVTYRGGGVECMCVEVAIERGLVIVATDRDVN